MFHKRHTLLVQNFWKKRKSPFSFHTASFTNDSRKKEFKLCWCDTTFLTILNLFTEFSDCRWIAPLVGNEGTKLTLADQVNIAKHFLVPRKHNKLRRTLKISSSIKVFFFFFLQFSTLRCGQGPTAWLYCVPIGTPQRGGAYHSLKLEQFFDDFLIVLRMFVIVRSVTIVRA